eukprot:TRINITY_DN1891_c0_g1_i27.p1 TRINITY_DN1891_c0_g1~~TRINITY_DN1891_c0_g1_i27.p1  ORF type:complete len:231 (+),score=19.03 TRINITY_DN1891_c0_g1_i27:59-751(+)
MKPHSNIPQSDNRGNSETSNGKQNLEIDTSTSQKVELLPQNETGLKIRIVVFILVTAFVVISKNLILPSEDAGCFRDHLFNVLNHLNELARNDPAFRSAIQISSSLLMDIVYLSLFFHWVAKGTSSRILITALSFYAFRGMVMNLALLGFPHGYVWDHPGFPSIVVPYGRTSDFFFSGHCGFLMICASEYMTIGLKWAGVFTHLVNLYMAAVMLICRIHYTIGKNQINLA